MPIIYNSYSSDYLKDETNGRELINDFPFISLFPIIEFRGKFSNKFYDKIPYRWKASFLENVDFFRLVNNPFLYDFIYIQPIWLENFTRISSDLFENICYSYNMSNKEKEILKSWIKQGGILWVESGLFATGYETFTTRVDKSDEEILKELAKKSSNMNFLNFDLLTYHYAAKKIDLMKIKPKESVFTNLNQHKEFKNINSLLLNVDNFIENYFILNGKTLMQDKNGNIIASYVDYGDGKIVSLLPINFTRRYYDGELFRWKLLFYFLDKKSTSTKNKSL